MTSGQVAINMGCDFIGLEGSPAYVYIGLKRLASPWKPVSERKKQKPKRQKRSQRQNEFQFDG